MAPARAPAPSPAGPSAPAAVLPADRAAGHDPRWPPLCAALDALLERGRRAVRIVDLDCGAGSFLLHAAQRARALGFAAIEGRGIDGSPAAIGRARAAAARAAHPAIGLRFETGDLLAVLREEGLDLPADILLWHGSRARDLVPPVDLLHRAAAVVIGDADAPAGRRA